MNVQWILGVVIFVAIFAALIPTVANVQQDSTNQSQKGANVTGAAYSLATLITLMFVAGGIIVLFRAGTTA